MYRVELLAYLYKYLSVFTVCWLRKTRTEVLFERGALFTRLGFERVPYACRLPDLKYKNKKSKKKKKAVGMLAVWSRYPSPENPDFISRNW